METLKAARIGIYHQDCIASISTEKFPGIELWQISPVVVLSQKKSGVKYDIIWRANAHSRGELEEYLDFLKTHKSTQKMDMLHSEKKSALFLQRISGPNSSYERVLKSGCMYIGNVPVREGLELHPVIATDPRSIEKLVSEMKEVGDTKLIRVGDYRAPCERVNLTEKQLEALKIALDGGYYRWPRQATLCELAKTAKISRRSMQERIRRGEAKLIPKAIGRALRGIGHMPKKD